MRPFKAIQLPSGAQEIQDAINFDYIKLKGWEGIVVK